MSSTKPLFSNKINTLAKSVAIAIALGAAVAVGMGFCPEEAAAGEITKAEPHKVITVKPAKPPKVARVSEPSDISDVVATGSLDGTMVRTLITLREGDNGEIIFDAPEQIDNLVRLIDEANCVTFIKDDGKVAKRWAFLRRFHGTTCAVMMATDVPAEVASGDSIVVSPPEPQSMVAATRK